MGFSAIACEEGLAEPFLRDAPRILLRRPPPFDDDLKDTQDYPQERIRIADMASRDPKDNPKSLTAYNAEIGSFDQASPCPEPLLKDAYPDAATRL